MSKVTYNKNILDDAFVERSTAITKAVAGLNGIIDKQALSTLAKQKLEENGTEPRN